MKTFNGCLGTYVVYLLLRVYKLRRWVSSCVVGYSRNRARRNFKLSLKSVKCTIIIHLHFRQFQLVFVVNWLIERFDLGLQFRCACLVLIIAPNNYEFRPIYTYCKRGFFTLSGFLPMHSNFNCFVIIYLLSQRPVLLNNLSTVFDFWVGLKIVRWVERYFG